MIVTVFDCETTGKTPDSHKVQIAALMFEDDREWARVHAVVECPVAVPAEAAAIHGKDQAMTQRYGIQPRTALTILLDLFDRSDVVVAHNLSYDLGILDTAYVRYMPVIGDIPAPKATCCTMRASTDLCRIPGHRGGFKWPRLAEALKILCNHDLEGAHDAMADVEGCAVLYRWLRDGGHV